MSENNPTKTPTKEDIINLYKTEEARDGYCALRHWGVASRLGTNPDDTLRVMLEMEQEGILFRGSGAYYGLNPLHLWKNDRLKNSYA